jgi:glycosyltransferase involved in cell wall biosynthesis
MDEGKREKKRILVVGPVPPPRGGIASLMMDLVDSSLKYHYDFELFARQFTFPKWAKDPLTRNLIRAHKYMRYFIRLLTRDYSLVHTHSPGHRFMQSAVYMFLARLLGIKVLLHLHGNEWAPFYPEKSRLNQRLIEFGLKRASKILVIREQWVGKIRELLSDPDVSLMPNMIPPRRPSDPEEMERTLQRLDLDHGDFIALLAGAGAVGRDKGILDIIEAAPEVAAKLDRIRFVIAGGEEVPGQMDHALELIEKKGLSRWMRILGDVEREEVLRILDLSSIFLLPSYIEGMPISIMEAMRAGVPVVATPVGAIPEMIKHEDSGLLIDKGSPDQIATALLRLAEDDELGRALSARGLEVFHSRFNLERGAKRVRMIYQELMD